MRWIMTAVSLVVLAALGLYMSFFVVTEGQMAIVTRFGRPVSIIREPGLKFKMPTDQITRMDKRINILETEPTQVLLEDKKPLIVSTYAAWRISDPLLYFQSVGDAANARRKLEDIVTSAVGMVLTRYATSTLFSTSGTKSTLEGVEKSLLEAVRDDARSKYGIEVVRVGVTRLAYPSVVIRSVYERMKSERLKEAERIKAEGEERAGSIRAEADKKAAIIEAEAKKKALMLEGQGDRQAMQAYSGAYSKSPRFFTLLRKLDAYEEILGKDDVVILSTSSPLVRQLFGADVHAGKSPVREERR